MHPSPLLSFLTYPFTPLIFLGNQGDYTRYASCFSPFLCLTKFPFLRHIAFEWTTYGRPSSGIISPLRQRPVPEALKAEWTKGNFGNEISLKGK